MNLSKHKPAYRQAIAPVIHKHVLTINMQFIQL